MLEDAREKVRCRSRGWAGVLYLRKVDGENSDRATEGGPLRAMLNMGYQSGQMGLAAA